jgi:hypothetical protein
MMLSRRTLLAGGLSSLLLLPRVGHPHRLAMLDVLHPARRDHPLLRGCKLWLLCLPGKQWQGSLWRNLMGAPHGTPTNFAPQTTATRGFAPATTRRGGYGELRVPGTNATAEGGIFLPVDQLQFLEGMTLAFWVNLPATPDSAAHRFIAAGATTVTRAYAVLNVASQSRLQFFWAGSNRLTMTGDLGTKTWHHVVGTRTGTLATSMIARWYIDGVLDSASGALANDPNPAAGDYTTIGCRTDGLLSPNALMDDMMLYDRPLDAGAVRALYQDGVQGHPELLTWIDASTMPATTEGAARVRIRSQMF